MFKKNEKSLIPNEAPLVAVLAPNFRTEVLDSKQPVLVEFWSSWSRACQVFDPVLEEVAVALAGKVKVVKVDADDNLDLSLGYEVECLPTLVCFSNGKPCLRIVGTATKDAILARLKAFRIIDEAVGAGAKTGGKNGQPEKEN